MAALQDPEFGSITLRRTRQARNVRLKLDSRGIISISLPPRTPLFIAKQLLNESRPNLRQMLAEIKSKQPTYSDGDLIGKSHTLRFETADGDHYNHRLEQQHLVISRPVLAEPAMLEETIFKGINKALRTQAKAYLPRRLQQLADQHGFSFQRTRFGNAGTRWGSCSSEGTISLNISLMQLPFNLIDYVLIHELCHTRQMNHSQSFWLLVEGICPDYKLLRRQLKQFHPLPTIQ